MEDIKGIIIMVISIVLFIVVCFISNDIQKIKMADRGYCQEMSIGNDSPIWVKCK